MRFSDKDDELGPIEPPYRPLELDELKAKGVKLRPLGVNYEMDVMSIAFAVDHKTSAKAFAQTALNMLGDMFSQGDGADCEGHISDMPDGTTRITMLVPHALYDRMDSVVIPALDDLDDDSNQGVRAKRFSRTPR